MGINVSSDVKKQNKFVVIVFLLKIFLISRLVKMGKISEHVFRVQRAGNLASWYERVMGMEIKEDTKANTWSAHYPGEGVKLVFQEAGSGPQYSASRDSCYWKIGVTVR